MRSHCLPRRFQTERRQRTLHHRLLDQLSKTIVEASKNELMPAARAQTQLIDQMIDDWRDRLSDPEFIEPPQKMMPAGQPETNANLALAPAQAWLEATAAWQKHWADAMRAWTTNSHRAGKGEG